MAKIILEGAVNLELEVKYGLDEDRIFNVQAIEFEVDSKQYKVLIGQGDMCDIPTKTIEFIGSRIEHLLKRNESLITVNGVGGFFKPGHKISVSDSMASKIAEAMMKTELGKIMLKTYTNTLDERRDIKSLKEVAERNLWFVSTSGMMEFCRLKRWYATMSSVINKYF